MTKGQFNSRLTYPNPFNPSGLELELPDGGLVTLQILDAEGRELVTLYDRQFMAEGMHRIEFYNARGEVRWDPERPRGQRIYFYRLSVDVNGRQQIDTKKIVLE